MSMELFKMMMNTDIVHVPYIGSAPALTYVMGGHVMMIFDNTPNVVPHIKTGRMRAIAVTSLQRTTFVPGVPTVDESGVPGYEVLAWFGVMATAGVPREIVAKLTSAVIKLRMFTEVRARFLSAGMAPVDGRAQPFA